MFEDGGRFSSDSDPQSGEQLDLAVETVRGQAKVGGYMDKTLRGKKGGPYFRFSEWTRFVKEYIEMLQNAGRTDDIDEIKKITSKKIADGELISDRVQF